MSIGSLTTIKTRVFSEIDEAHCHTFINMIYFILFWFDL